MIAPPEPSWRKPVGIALIFLLIVGWAALVASAAEVIETWPVLVQALFYLIMGIAWIIPLKPLIRWIETGQLRSPSDPRD
jgi:predicted membrane channel-forming protein YqfA (hemolysin III family)